MRTAGSTRTSRTSPAGSPPTASWPWRGLPSRRWVARRSDEDKARDMIGTLDQAKVTADAKAAVAWLKARPDGNGKVGIVGFCWGGGVVGRVAVADPELDAAVVFYGEAPPTEGVAKIKAPLLLNYAGLDQRIDAGIPAFEAALKEHGQDLHALHVRGRQPRLQQRYLGRTLQRGGGQARLAAHGRLLQGNAAPGLSGLLIRRRCGSIVGRRQPLEPQHHDHGRPSPARGEAEPDAGTAERRCGSRAAIRSESRPASSRKRRATSARRCP